MTASMTDKSNRSNGRRSRSEAARNRDADAEVAALNALRQKLSGVLRRLPDVERRVVELRMGLVDGTPAKPGEVADRLGMTIPEVKKIEARAFSRIREVGPIKGLERFLGR
ncbi:MAG: hypothetical protein GEU74_08270 [Nitriliruptorales bacterium]|nr:hypothetical protein [Nitriliruptorales bacterium]